MILLLLPAPLPLSPLCTQSCDSTSDSDGRLFVQRISLKALLFAKGGGLDTHGGPNNDHFPFLFLYVLQSAVTECEEACDRNSLLPSCSLELRQDACI